MFLWRSLDPKTLMAVLASTVGREAKAPAAPLPQPAPVVPVKGAVA